MHMCMRVNVETYGLAELLFTSFPNKCWCNQPLTLAK